MKLRIGTWLVGFLLFVGVNGFGQEADVSSDSVRYRLNQVVVTANRYEKEAFETHIPVTTIQPHEVWQSGLDNVGEILQQTPGVDFSSAGPWSQKLVIRGLVSPQVLTLIDGMRLDILRGYGNHAPLIDVNQVERIEVIRGPASTLYGSEAIAGVVNYITRQPSFNSTQRAFHGNAGLHYSSVNNQSTEHALVTSNHARWSLLVGVSNRKADDIRTPTGTLINTAFNGYTLNTKIGARLSENHSVTLSGQSNRMKDVGVPTNPYSIRAKFLKYNHDVISLNYAYQAKQRTWTDSKLTLYYQQGERNFETYIFQKPNGALFVNQLLNANRQVNSFGSNFQNSFSLIPGNVLVAGIDLYSEFDETDRIADAVINNAAGVIVKDPPADLTPPSPKAERKSLGVYIEDEHTVATRLTITAGARFDYMISHADGTPATLAAQNIDKMDQDFSGNLGALYRLTPRLHLMANIGRAFKAPTLQERLFAGTAQVGYLYGNPALNSERSLNMDGGFKWQTVNFSGEFNLFHNRITDFIVMKPISAAADTFLYDNVGKAALFGGELQIRYNLTRRISLLVSSSYTRGEDETSGDALPKVPPFQGIVGLRFDGTGRAYWIEFNGRFVAAQDRVADDEPATDGYNLFNFSSGINVQSVIRSSFPLYVTFHVRNLFDKSYRDHLSYVTWWDAPGRNISIGLNSSF
ncbi:MAG: TonB-dependent receptor [Candidatus Zhuqueibacterota bacterium]